MCRAQGDRQHQQLQQLAAGARDDEKVMHDDELCHLDTAVIALWSERQLFSHIKTHTHIYLKHHRLVIKNTISVLCTTAPTHSTYSMYLLLLMSEKASAKN